MLKLSEIWTYPVKSLGGVSLPSAAILSKGLEHDRRWMLVSEDDTLLTQRSHPRMALFKTSLHRDHVEVRFAGDVLQIPFEIPAHEGQRARVWNDEVFAIPMGAEYDRWFSARLEVGCRLLAFPEDKPRPVEPGYTDEEVHVRLQDAFPFLVIGQASLDELNKRLDTPVPMNRFRPNLVFTGGLPHEEDTWKEVSIGGHTFTATRQCVRCTLPGVDQEPGIPGKEPLRALASYRKTGNKVMFGMNLIGPTHGELRVGDEIRVLVAENMS
ncbi:MAG: MOSC domain-containing protein [Cyclobacteriaceae bacterium]|nr:MOSC domain-containing protein [Cyclobacteriaceae bacterium]